MHAMNNALGGEFFTDAKLRAAAAAVVEESVMLAAADGHVSVANISDHMAASGWLSEEAIAKAALFMSDVWCHGVPHPVAHPITGGKDVV